MELRTLCNALGIHSYSTTAEAIDQTAFDEKLAVDLRTGACETLFHIEGKYFSPLTGSLDNIVDYAAHLIHPEDRKKYHHFMNRTTLPDRLHHAPEPGILESFFRHRTISGEWIWTRYVFLCGAAHGVPVNMLYLYIFDIDSQMQRHHGQQIIPTRTHTGIPKDPLTGLYVEKDFFELAESQLSHLRGQWCIVDMDIEHYKLFADWHGVATAHQLIADIGTILKNYVSSVQGIAGYFGADDFALLIPYDREGIESLWQQIHEKIVSISHTVGFLPILGVCQLDASTVNILEAYNHAALTSEELKGNLHTRIGLYNMSQQKAHNEEYHLLLAFQDAIRGGEITFDLQPQCLVGSGKIVGAESLARWRRPDGTTVSPAVFVPILEKFGIVTNLDQFIWEAVCRWIRNQLDNGLQPVPVSVNVSQIDIHSIDVPAFFASLLQRFAIPASLLKIEITESAYVDDTDIIQEAIQRFHEMGLLVLMDDFGSGYSSLNMLRTLHMDVIKLDAQFLHMGEREERKGISILESIIHMTQTLATPIIVEGVETQEQVDYLMDLGCLYMQGFHFYRPMSKENFAHILEDTDLLDHNGFRFRSNQELHTREFLDRNVYSDAMLNNILGPVAFYCWKGENVDIIRYNKQFFSLVGIEIPQMNERINHIQRFFYPSDTPKFYQILETAYEDHLNGAEGIVRVYRPNGVLLWLSIHVYLIGEDDTGRIFYASAKDVSELQYISADLPGGYYRTTLEDGFIFLYISQNFQKMTGYSSEEIQKTFDNRLLPMIHPKDRNTVIAQTQKIANGELEQLDPYRLRRSSGDYIWVADRSRLTDSFGNTCWQSVLIDVSEMMETRNHMRLLIRYSSLSIVFLMQNEKGPHFRVIVHGMENHFQLGAEAFEQAMNSGAFYRWIAGSGDGKKCNRVDARMAQNDQPSFAMALLQVLDGYFAEGNDTYENNRTVRFPDERREDIRIRIDKIRDAQRSAQYILVFSSR